ncbi:MAG: purine-nucleoside phosphorylase [Bacteroidales bacterium]|jgi:purine-nucleoside phosphorylase|nr:purine-nucleoside phosphorylase [Bacteroidales bacterium]
MLKKIEETAAFLKSQGFTSPDAGIVLGTGLGGLVSKIKIIHEVDYSQIPNFPVSTVEGHEGKLIYGEFGSKKIVAMKGRFHFYEGYSSAQIVFPIRVMKYLGIKYLFLSNAAGGTNPDFEVGDIMIITDHINFLPNPLIGPNNNMIGPRFPDMSEAYDKLLVAKAEEVARELNIKIKKGVYLATTGPTFETPAEYKHFRHIGADAVGMSTVPEVIVARHMGLPCFAVSIISDLGVEGKIHYITHEMVTRAAAATESKMTSIMTHLIEKI